MRFNTLLFPLLLAVNTAWSQNPIPASAASSAAQPATHPTGVVSRTEHIQVEDSGARIDEERVGGQTQTITVQPKGGLPSYQVAPQTGERTWKVMGF
ncbi:hypothetical protein MIZ03_1572 [Rhodoferax lithotrophicus]|uniref:DUF2782 domain-containing protein n=1 Tax=Rhodoferax lithotrophicus TaxID=2798804 RepID=A0ABM7MKG4_9BURK|nr:hypothetical protein [Rhodoferax sp. MIZ03]BCO26689.1 hypothetical protein MIZ03_1572 [Rhodoferax sp. MIZ03]